MLSAPPSLPSESKYTGPSILHAQHPEQRQSNPFNHCCVIHFVNVGIRLMERERKNDSDTSLRNKKAFPFSSYQKTKYKSLLSLTAFIHVQLADWREVLQKHEREELRGVCFFGIC